LDSLQETLRQIRIAGFLIATVLTIGVVGFMTLEGYSLVNALWLTVITLATVGYGDIFARTDAGRIFTIFLLAFGLSVFAFGIQAGANFFISPAIRDLRRRQLNDKRISKLDHHYIICGYGELVDKTIAYLLQRAEARRKAIQQTRYQQVDQLVSKRVRWLRLLLYRLLMLWNRLQGEDTLINIVVVITHDQQYATRLRQNNLLVLEGLATDDDLLKRAGIAQAQALMAMLDSDTETLLTVLTARGLNPLLYITAATLDEELAQKMVRVGANNVIAPYELAGTAMNSATLRPAVYAFFNNILFDYQTGYQATQLFLYDDSPWIGKTLHKLRLHEIYDAGVIGLRLEDGHYLYAPSEDRPLQEEEVLIVVAPAKQIPALQAAVRSGVSQRPRSATWQRLPPLPPPELASAHTYSLLEAADEIQKMNQHYIICGTGRVARNAVNQLNPERPFVILSDDNAFTSDLIKHGFRVIHGKPTQESVLRKAGVERALAMMVCIDDPADAVLTVLNVRALSKRILITAIANTDDMILKLQRAGADGVANPFNIAAQWVLLSTTRPAVSDFLQYVVYNYHARLETTELYMETDSPWIGNRLADLRLERLFRAGVIGIRHENGQFTFAPDDHYEIRQYDILIVVTPMQFADELRSTAHGSITKRPTTLRERAVG
jgi:voltage-gated potassium channel